MNIKLIIKHLLVFFLCYVSAVAQDNHAGKYLKYIDSADNHIDDFPKIAALYLDSIPKPLDKSINGHIACYYRVKAFINENNKERVLEYQNHLLSLKYAKLEKNYDVAGDVSLFLFYSTTIINNDTLAANNYLKDAKAYFELSKNNSGLADVTQMYAYKAINEMNYEKSNSILLKHLNEYEKNEDEAYYYLFALYSLTANYICLDDLKNAHKYFNLLKTLEGNPTISPPSLYRGHVVPIYGYLSEYYFKEKNIDSTLFYLNKSNKMRDAMDETNIREYYSLYIDYYDYVKNYEVKNNYVDSLRIFEEKELTKNIEATIEVNNVLLDSELELKNERNEKIINRVWIIILITGFVLVGVFFKTKMRKSKKVIKNLKKNGSDYTYLKTNHEKLQVKAKGMEGYISELKKEVKNISLISNKIEQHNQVKVLYKNIHHNTSALLSKGEDHLGLINELNVDFFNQLSTKHPNLNSSELIVCYYLFTGFKSREIGVFLNTSTRAIEGKRYRIANKLNVKAKEYTLVEYLITTFDDTK